MKRMVVAGFITLIVVLIAPQATFADGSYVVRAGDTLISIAKRYGVSVQSLANTNGLAWDAWVYVGQRLTIPGSTSWNGGTSGSGTYTVQTGDTLYSIALRYNVSTSMLQTANNLANANFIYSGQQLVIPGGRQNQAIRPSTSSAYTPQSSHERWIDVNLSTQTVTAYEGQKPVSQMLASTGTRNTPTIVGTFEIYVKYPSTRMTGNVGGDYYDLANVPHVMYFYQGYGLHGTYWHNNFGTPMSHGCVNLSQADAAWLYDWAAEGTTVVTHY